MDMKVRDITELIEKRIPRQAAEDWDNPGLLVGDPDREVRRIYVALDATDQVIGHAAEMNADLLITHHPMIFHGVTHVSKDDYIGRRIMALVENHIAYYAMHTNYDVCEMGDLAAGMLDLKDCTTLDVTYDGRDIDPEAARGDGTDAVSPIQISGQMGIGKVGVVADATDPTLKDYAARVRNVFGISHVTVFGDPQRRIHRVAISPGSGKSNLDNAVASGADVYVSGDIDHHTGIDGVAKGIAVIDAGHYGIEHIFIEKTAMALRALLEDVDVRTEPYGEPDWVV